MTEEIRMWECQETILMLQTQEQEQEVKEGEPAKGRNERKYLFIDGQ